ncbi:MAG TPA: NADH-quinone oxidoreductase subunit J [candidate division Zixibacteria bacterium]
MVSGTQIAAFYILAGIIICSSVMVVTMKNIFHSALFLVLCFFSVAGIYILLEAEFVAAVQVLIYVGAITVLMIFAIMLTSQIYSPSIKQSNEQVIPALLIVVALLIVTLVSLAKTTWRINTALPTEQSTVTIGKSLLTVYVLPFEVVSVVLLVALVGAIVIAKKE